MACLISKRSRPVLRTGLLIALLASFLLSLGAAAADVPAGAGVGGDNAALAEETRQGILTALMAAGGASNPQDWINGQLAEEAGRGGEEYLLALVQDGTYDTAAFAASLQRWLNENTEKNAATREKLALTFLACGFHSDYIEQTMLDSPGKMGIMSWVFALHLANNGYAAPYTVEELLDTLLSLEKEDGGWAVIGTVSDPDTTAMTIQALAPYYGENADVTAAVDRALERLSQIQQPDGGFIGFDKPNPETAAQVMTALCALGINPLSDPRFTPAGANLLQYMLTFRQPDGTFAHVKDGASDPIATRQVFFALTAYARFLKGQGSMYLYPAPAGEAAELLRHPGLSLRGWLTVGIAALALLACLVLLLRHDRRPKEYLLVLLLAGLAVLLVQKINITSKDKYYVNSRTSSGSTITTYITIRCDTVKGRSPHIPADGVILAREAVTLPEGSSAFDQLTAAVRAHSLHMEKEDSSFGSVYVNAIGNIYEFDFGDLSGWMFSVNGVSAEVGCGTFTLHEGDEVLWAYTCDLGHDIGLEKPGSP